MSAAKYLTRFLIKNNIFSLLFTNYPFYRVLLGHAVRYGLQHSSIEGT